MDTRKTAKEFLLITLGTAIIAAAVFFFLQPCHLALGSVSGLAIVLNNLVPFSVSAITLLINVVLLVVGFLLIGREFGGKTVYTSILLPTFLGLFEYLFPKNTSLTSDPFLDMICYLFIVSFGQSILFNQNASSGGLDIVGKLLNKFFRIEIGKAISMAGICIALSSALVYDTKTLALSVLGTYLNGIVLDYFIFGSNVKRRICIISSQQDEIVHYIIHVLHSGATLYQAKGAYSGEPKQEIIVIVNKEEYRLLVNHIISVDPNAFVTIYNVNELIYRPKCLCTKNMVAADKTP